MNQEGNATLNNQQSGGESSAPLQTGGLISTTEFTTPKPSTDADPEVANKTEGSDKGSEGQESAESKESKESGEKTDEETDKELSGQEDRFDKHPRFKEIRTRADNAEKRVTQLEAKIERLLEGQTQKPGKEELPFKDINKMSAEELLDFQAENPHAYYQNVLAQAKHELGSDFDSRLEQRSSEDAIVDTFQRFADDHPDFDEMWDRGELKAFMDQNPGHNAISAYQILTLDKTIEDAVDKAVKEAEKKFTANQRAKRESKSLSGGPQTTGTQDAPKDSELQDSTKFGGKTRVLANRLREFRKKQAAGV